MHRTFSLLVFPPSPRTSSSGDSARTPSPHRCYPQLFVSAIAAETLRHPDALDELLQKYSQVPVRKQRG